MLESWSQLPSGRKRKKKYRRKNILMPRSKQTK
jgi:hypothetical protein